MHTIISSIRAMRAALDAASESAAKMLIAESSNAALLRANRNTAKNTYLWRDPAWTLSEVEHLRPPSSPLHGIPISVKDCFDLAGAPTSCGTRYYRDLHGIAPRDSWLVDQLRSAGAVITGKTHLHPLAYGITGENPDFGDCIQPGNDGALTGGSSSGAAASVLEGSAMAAIGTDTGGSIRVPAALCGLAGYRASLGRGDWRGGAHLAPSFDTMGWLYRDLEDGPLLGSFFDPHLPQLQNQFTSFAVIDENFLTDCEPAVLESYRHCRQELQSLGLTPITADVTWWTEAMEIFAPIQASEAARIHAGHFDHFESSIRQRLEWGASLPAQEVQALRQRHEVFRNRMDTLLAQHHLLLMPAAPVVRLNAGADHSQTRARLLRYTSPVSLAGMPTVTIPYFSSGRPAGGMQLVAAREDDASLLHLSAQLGRLQKTSRPQP